MSTVGKRYTKWVTLALVAWAGLFLDASESWAIGPALYLEPIPGLTSQRYDVPDELSVPIGTVLRFRQTFISPSSWVEVVWTGAVEESRDATASVAVCPLDRAGVHVVTATLRVHGRVRASFSCRLNVVDVTVEQIQIRPLRIPEAQLRLTEYATNEETMAAFFGDSIAALRPAADRRDFRTLRRFSKSSDVPPCYVTSVGRAIELGVDVTPSALASVMEWRIDGQPPRLGGSTSVTFQAPGRHVISVGPFRSEQRIEIETYRVSIVSHTSRDDIVPEGQAITFEAVTNPPGYEDHITWLSSTKYGTATPVLGYGATFTAQFDDTWGAHDATGEPFQWLGVKADNIVFNQDQKIGACCLTADERCYQDVTVTDCKDVLGGDFGGDGALCEPELCAVAPAMYCRYNVGAIAFAGGCTAETCPITVDMNASAWDKECDIVTDCPTPQNFTFACAGGGTCETTEDRKDCR